MIFFYVKKPTDIVNTDNQLSATRALNSEFAKTSKQVDRLISKFSKDYNVDISSSFSFGNVKNEIDTFLENNDPDIIVIGKRKRKALSLLGDNITQHILNKKNKTVIIASQQNELEPHKEISLGVFNELTHEHNNDFVDEVIKNVQTPLKKFKIVNSNEHSKITDSEKQSEDAIEFVFEQNDSVMNNLSSYIIKNDVNLLLVDRKQGGTESINSFKKLVNKLDVSLLVAS